ncbi:MAG: DUF3990 domain-containing protein [Ruminococcus sp.]|nr:DUF3990 domain-containing protein [Ruminococcus sp.]
MILFHAGYDVIEAPDIHFGRRNADFGQGFYTTDSEELAKRWIKQRNDRTAYLNTYELDTTALKIKDLPRGEEWFEYIYANRHLMPDTLSGYDVISGAVANDTIFDTLGLTTSGVLDKAVSLKALMAGNEYRQITLKTEKAAAALRFTGADIITPEESRHYSKLLEREEKAFQEEFFGIVGQEEE